MNTWKYLFGFLLASASLLVFALTPLFDNRLHLVFCDVGQGDGILIYQKQTQIVVDAGPDGKILSCLSRHMPFWDRRIELAIITNADLDHYGGFIDIVQRYDVGAFGTNMIGKNDKAFEALEDEIEKEKIPVSGLNYSGAVTLKKLKLTVLWPSKEELANVVTPAEGSKVLGATTDTTVNPYSLVLKLSYGAFDALLTGDIVPPATDEMAEGIGGLEGGGFEVLKVPHHGSKNGLTQKLVEKTKPQLAVISAGKNNRFGHPHKEVIELLSDKAIKILRTDTEGEIEIVTDGATWQVK